MPRKKTNRLYVLPSRLKEAKDALVFPSQKTRHKVSKFLFKLINDGMLDNYNLQKFQEIPVKYFRKAYGGNYKAEFLNALEVNNIIQINHSYWTGDEKTEEFCKSYRIHPDMLDEKDTFVKDSYVNEEKGNCKEDDRYMNMRTRYRIDKEGDTYSTGSVAYMLHKLEKAVVKADLGSLRYDIAAFKDKMEEVVNGLSCANFLVDDEVTENYFEVTDHVHGWTRERTKQWCLTFCKAHGLSLIQDKRKFYIDDLDRYIAKKKSHIKLNYDYYSAKLKEGIFTPHRNKRNNRVDHNLTNICKETTNIIIKDNDLVEIDMKCSQFTFFANWLKEAKMTRKYEDVSRFYTLCTTGKLYSTVAYMLHKPEKVAKQAMMCIAFSSWKNNTPAKAAFKKEFPNVAKFMDDHKKFHIDGYKEFAVKLQKLEARVFVDDLYSNIKNLGFFCLTKHDSLIVKRSDVDEVLKVLRSYFLTTGFECTLEVDHKPVSMTQAALEAQNQDETPMPVETKPEAKEVSGENVDGLLLNLDGLFKAQKSKEVQKPATEEMAPRGPEVKFKNYTYRNPCYKDLTNK